MRPITIMLAVLTLAGCANGMGGQQPAPPPPPTASSPMANPAVPGNNSSVPAVAPATRSEQTGQPNGR